VDTGFRQSPEITNYKTQNTNKLQISMTQITNLKSPNRYRLNPGKDFIKRILKRVLVAFLGICNL